MPRFSQSLNISGFAFIVVTKFVQNANYVLSDIMHNLVNNSNYVKMVV